MIIRACIVPSLLAVILSIVAATATNDATTNPNQNNKNQQNHQQQSQRIEARQKPTASSRQVMSELVSEVQIECNSDNISVTLTTVNGFNGMIYPKGLSKNSTCMVEYESSSQRGTNITYQLPLRSCNTMSADVADGVEYFNTVMVQPHKRLVTNQGRGYHVRCKYQTKERTVTNLNQQLNVNLTQTTPAVFGAATMPTCTMKIYATSTDSNIATNDLSATSSSSDDASTANNNNNGSGKRKEVSAENVKIGDELQLVIALEDQDVYGMLVTGCLVRDGLNWGEQPLIDDEGCPVDEEIMPNFAYSSNYTRATVTFQAHKFPYTSSVYYQCNVKLCFRDSNCGQQVPPKCSSSNGLGGHMRRKRWTDAGTVQAIASSNIKQPAGANRRSLTIQVASGLRVGDGAALSSAETNLGAAEQSKPLPAPLAQTARDETTDTTASNSGATIQTQQQQPKYDKDFCISIRKFAIAISLLSLIIMLAMIILMACILQRRKRRRLEQEQWRASRPYANRAYCRD